MKKDKSALGKNKLDTFIASSDARTISKIWHEMHLLLYLTFCKPDLDFITTISSKYPYLKEFIDFDIILVRAKNLPRPKKLSEEVIGIPIYEFFFELSETRDAFAEAFVKIPNGVEKAELWLYPEALHVGADADIEAAIYFACKGEYFQRSEEVKENWRKAICDHIVKENLLLKLSEPLLVRAKEHKLSLSEAIEILSPHSYISFFFSCFDNEEDYILSSVFRAVEWFEIKGFDQWLKTYVDISSGDNPIESSWQLFYWCRSNLALKMTKKFVLESKLYGISQGQFVTDIPWRILNRNPKAESMYEDYLPIASILLFVWKRINPENIDSECLQKAAELLFQTQLVSGAWPLSQDESEGCILSTCLAIHGLALSKPSGYQDSITRAKNWLMTQQTVDGFWNVQGGPPIMLTVLCLDAIHLAEGNKAVTFLPRICEEPSTPDKSERIEKNLFVIENWPDVLEDADQGTGLYIGNSYILTCQHIFRKGTKSIEVFAPILSDKKYRADLEWKDELLDLAVLKLIDYKPNVDYPKIEKTDIQRGQNIYAAGYPNYSPGSTMEWHEGLILGSRKSFGNTIYTTDIKIISGMSGGPVFNRDFYVIGVMKFGNSTHFEADKKKDQHGIVSLMGLPEKYCN